MKKAFTLIELLVVIAIIAILAAILFPVFAQAKAAAKSTQGLSNIRNLALSEKLYAGDYDDSILPVRTYSSTPGNPAYIDRTVQIYNGTWPNPAPGTRLANYWLYYIQPYIKSVELYKDPSFSKDQLIKAIDDPFCDGANYYETNFLIDPVVNYQSGVISAYSFVFPLYSPAVGTASSGGCLYNNSGTVGTQTCPYFNYAGSGPDGTGWQQLTETAVVNPASQLVVGDGAVYAYKNAAASRYGIFSTFGCSGAGRHGQSGSNWGFLDGHAKFIPVNPELILSKDSGGTYYATHFSYDK